MNVGNVICDMVRYMDDPIAIWVRTRHMDIATAILVSEIYEC